ncbi:glycosyltransferase [Endozoicomonas acroporae]|uniref:glycosyltransferase n=1 Tax=Endozoicomonas acroporae TaxID=1701104 RepID=UPI003D7A069A
MSNKVLVTSFDMEIGGVERSLAAMLSNFDYQNNKVDLHLHSHSGPLLNLLPKQVHLLPELATCKSYRQSIKQVILSGNFILGLKRLYARIKAEKYAKDKQFRDAGYYQYQEIWRLCVNNTEVIEYEYDVAISYLWPHHFTAFNVRAKTKIAWIHTDYSTIDIDVEADLAIWEQFDYIISISDACTDAFVKTHPSLQSKIVVVENITNADFVRAMAVKPVEHAISKQTFNLVSVGRLCTAKAFDRAVEVLSLVHEKGFANIKWYIIGEGGDKLKIEALIKQYQLQDSFILLGSTTNPYPYMKAADLYVQPSRYEGKAVTVAEAKILAKPILITDYATSASQIDNGIDGVICSNNTKSIANTIIALFNDEAARNALSNYCYSINHDNSDELQKLYPLFDK